MKLYVGRDEYDDREFLLTVFDDGALTLATRPGYRATDVAWSSPVVLTAQSSAVTE